MSRNLAIVQAIARRLAQSGVSANAISVAGMICGIGAGVALGCTTLVGPLEQRLLWFAGGLLIQLRLAANMFDGMVAVETGTTSAVGELYNEVPDRISDAATLIGAGYAVGGSMELGYIAACLAILTAYVRAVGKVAGAPQEFCGPMAKQQRMFLVTAVALYLAVTPASWHPDWQGRGLAAAVLLLIVVGCLATVVRRLVRIGGNLT